jgi:hypothetical protein
MAPHMHNSHVGEGGVRLPVATAVEPVVGDLARGGDRAGAAQLGEHALGADPVRVVADQDHISVAVPALMPWAFTNVRAHRSTRDSR